MQAIFHACSNGFLTSIIGGGLRVQNWRLRGGWEHGRNTVAWWWAVGSNDTQPLEPGIKESFLRIAKDTPNQAGGTCVLQRSDGGNSGRLRETRWREIPISWYQAYAWLRRTFRGSSLKIAVLRAHLRAALLEAIFSNTEPICSGCTSVSTKLL